MTMPVAISLVPKWRWRVSIHAAGTPPVAPPRGWDAAGPNAKRVEGHGVRQQHVGVQPVRNLVGVAALPVHSHGRAQAAERLDGRAASGSNWLV